MNILFVIPRVSTSIFDFYNPYKKYYRFFARFIALRKPLAFQILAALTNKSHSVELVEGGLNDINYDKKYDIVGISSLTHNADLAYEIADEFRKRGINVVLGGYHPSALPEEAKQHADSVVIGEAEESWVQLLKDLEKEKLKSFYYPKKPVDPILIPHPSDIYPKDVGIGIQATRGCSFKCEFCSIPFMKYRNIFRMRPINQVIEEIREYTGNIFQFQDNSLTNNPKYTKKLFKELINLNKKFIAYGNIDVLGRDEELLKLARDAGCIGWFIGFESICQKSIDSVGKKNNRVCNYLSSIKKIHDYSMSIEGTFIFGFDFDTSKIFMETDDFVRKSEIDTPFGLILIPYPGTPIFEKLDREGRILTKDWSKYKEANVVFQPKNMTPEELLTQTFELNKLWHKKSICLPRILRNLNFGFYNFMENLGIEIYWNMSYKFNKKIS